MHRVLWCGLCLLIPSVASAQLMDTELQARLEKALPYLDSRLANAALHGKLPGKRLFYTGNEIEHASQDGTGSTVGFYLSAHNRSAIKDGKSGTDFQFPWLKPGGTDESEVYAWKVLFLPGDSKIKIHRRSLHSFFAGANGNVFFGRDGSNVNGYGWTFPEGTRFYELLSFADRLSVFEVRVRHKVNGKWRVNIYRPFVDREDFLAIVDSPTTQWPVEWFRLNDSSLHRNKTAFKMATMIEEIPGLSSTQEADKLIRSRVFSSALNRDWGHNSGAAPWTKSTTSIVPKGYNGAFVGNSQESCQKCHQDAATHVRFFDRSREWYGFVRGEREEKILSFHPVEPSAISRSGGHVPVRWSKKLLEAGIIEVDNAAMR